MRTTVRTSETDPNNNFHEQTTGDAPSSVEISVNAKGAAQFSLKLYYPSVNDLLTLAETDIMAAHAAITHAIAACGLPLARS